jgi:hypothetical protein
LPFPDSLPTFEYSPSRGKSPLCQQNDHFLGDRGQDRVRVMTGAGRPRPPCASGLARPAAIPPTGGARSDWRPSYGRAWCSRSLRPVQAGSDCDPDAPQSPNVQVVHTHTRTHAHAQAHARMHRDGPGSSHPEELRGVLGTCRAVLEVIGAGHWQTRTLSLRRRANPIESESHVRLIEVGSIKSGLVSCSGAACVGPVLIGSRLFFWKAYLPIGNTLNGKRPRSGVD